ncbi:MAG: hypothetical protein KC910_06160 [Candidatus Eremiobacteraeota bacterium]|nr:hypothetical protein [Candidatus Eremiobacteraeota bacterium]
MRADRLEQFLDRLREAGALEQADLVFTLDPVAARRRLEEFSALTLRDAPLLLVSAAVSLAAGSVQIWSESSGFQFEALGPQLGRQELEGLLAQVFGHRPRVGFTDLGLAVYTLLIEGADQVRVVSGPNCLMARLDGQQLVTQDEPFEPGWRLQVDSARVLERRELASRCGWAPIPLSLDGEGLNHQPLEAWMAALSQPAPESAPLAWRTAGLGSRGGRGFVSLGGSKRRASLVVDGLSFAVEPPDGYWPCEAVWWGDLGRDMTRLRLLEDERYQAALDWLGEAFLVARQGLVDNLDQLQLPGQLEVAGTAEGWARQLLAGYAFGEAQTVFGGLAQAGYRPALRPLFALCCLNHQLASLEPPDQQGLAQLLARGGQPTEAFECLAAVERAQRDQPGSARWRLSSVLLGMAWCVRHQGRLWEAEHHCRRAASRLLEAHPEQGLAHFEVSLAQLELHLGHGQIEMALRQLGAVPPSWEEHPICRARLADHRALALQAAGRLEEASGAAEGGWRLDCELFGPESPEARGSWALWCLLAGQVSQLSELAPGGALAVELAQAWLAKDNPGQALARLEQLTGLEGLWLARAHSVRALAWLALGQPEQALPEAAAAWQLQCGSNRLDLGWTIGYGWPVDLTIGGPGWPLVRCLTVLGREHLEAARTAAHMARCLRALEDPEADRWAGRAKAIRQTRVTVEVVSLNARLGGTDFGRNRTLKLKATVEAPGRRLRRVELSTSRGLRSSTHPDAEEGVALVMSGGLVLNQQQGCDLDLARGRELTIYAGDEKFVSRGRSAYVLELHFDEGPFMRVPVDN